METQILGDTLSRTVVGDGDDVFEGMFTDRVLVEKRDGRVVDFDPVNIVVAVKSAFADLDKEVGPQEERMILDIANQIEGEIRERYNGPAKIEDIQNLVEHALIEDHLYEVARTYTNYRLNKDIQRAKATDINEAVSRLVNRDESLVRENANKDSNVYATQRDLLAGAVSKASAFSMLPDAVANAHMKGDIHFHDADYSPFTSMNNCSLPDFGDMLKHGFALGNAMMDSPKSIGTASTQITQIIKDIAGAQYGGQTVNRADEKVQQAYKNSRDGIVVLPCYLPWKNGLYKTDALFVIYPSQRGGWSAQCVTDHKTKKPKLPFPQSWAGQPQEVIEQKSGIEGISFCHASRFLITAKDKETALAACRQVLKNNGRI